MAEMGVARKRTQTEQMRRRNGEERDRHAIDLEEHSGQADSLESSLHQLMIGPPPKPLDDAEIESWQRQLAAVRRWSEEESDSLKVQMLKDAKYASNLQNTVKQQLHETLDFVRQLERDVLGRVRSTALPS